MPKMKTKSAAAKRLKKTGSGKFKFKKTNLRHILTNKSKNNKRNLRKGGILAKPDEKRMNKVMPYA